jgi:hypothetical protein
MLTLRGVKMKKIVPIFVVGIFILSGFGAVALSEIEEGQYIQEKIFFSNPLLTEKEDYITVDLLESNTYSAEKDKPSIPIVSKTYILPFGAIVTDVKVSYDMISEVVISKPINPAPEPVIITDMSKSLKIEDNINSYSNIEIYPETLYTYRTGAGLKDGVHVTFLSINLYPIKYKPSQNIISYSKKATIDISYNLPKEPIRFGDTYELLIITPEEFTIQLQPLVDHKNDIGISTIMVTLNDIPTQGVDKQEDIKYYIKDAIENWGIQSVIIVGCAIEGEDIKFPVRYAWVPSGSYETHFPSDLYYADIYNSTGGFSNWDYDGDGKYCEWDDDIDAVDLYPDVYLSRLPCNNADEVTTVVNKFIQYKMHNKMTNKIVQIGGDTFPGDPEGIFEGEFANEEVLTKLPSTYSTTKLWGSLKKFYIFPSLTKPNINAEINSGVDFADFSGHGNQLLWSTHPPEDESKWIPSRVGPNDWNGYTTMDVEKLTNLYKLPVFVFNACSCSKYTKAVDCISWMVLKNPNGGGIASFGASGIGYGSYGSHETKRWFGWMEVNLFDELVNTKILGVVWGNALNGYINNFSGTFDDADYKTLVEMALFGDPTLAIEDGDNPKPYQYNENKYRNRPEKIFNFLLQKLIEYINNHNLLLNNFL